MFMAPVLKVGSLAGVASFPRQGVAVLCRAGGSSPWPIQAAQEACLAGRELCPVWVWTAPRACPQCPGKAGTQGTVAPCHLSILPMCIRVLVPPKHTPPPPLHTATWMTWLLLAFTCCHCHGKIPPVALGYLRCSDTPGG